MAKYPAMMAPKGSLLHNDDTHNFTDPNSGGGPRAVGKRVPHSQRGGVGHGGQRSHGSPSGSPRPTTPNPAGRGSVPAKFHPERRVPGHGGGPQMKGDFELRHHGGFGHSGQRDVPGNQGHAHPQPGAGNTSGRSHRLIAARFRRAAMGARTSGKENGKYGSPPVTANT